MQCQKCGKEIAADSKYCRFCGAPADANAPRSGSFGRKLINAALIAGIIAASGIGFALVKTPHDYQKEAELEAAQKKEKLNPALNSPADITDELISNIITNRLESLTINYEFAGCRFSIDEQNIFIIERMEEDAETYGISKLRSENKPDPYQNDRLARNPFWKANSRTPLKNIRFRIILTPQVTSLACAFEGFRELESVSIAVGPEIKDFTRTFRDAVKFNASLADWDVSGAVTMRQMFRNAKAFNQPLNSWNTGNVRDLRSMFYQAESFNQPLDKWNTGKTELMSRMFYEAFSFNGAIGSWDTSNTRKTDQLFYRAKSFNQPIGNWNTSRVKDMDEMFTGAKSFNQPIGNWNTGNVMSMRDMFRGADSFNQPVGNWDVSSVYDMEYMFSHAKAFNQPLDKWAFRENVNMSNMFNGAESFNQPLSSWKIPKKAYISGIVRNAKSYTYPNPEDERSK